MLRLGPSPLEPGESPSPPRRQKTKPLPPPRDGYVGTRVKKFPNGLGTWTAEDGSQWRGRWMEGRKHGRGTATYSNGTSIKGRWNKGQLQGRGESSNEDGSTYTGEYYKGLRHGEGVLRLPSGTEYKGEFKHGKMHGMGTCKTRAGFTLIGKWAGGKVNGNCILKCPDGSSITKKWTALTVPEVIRAVLEDRAKSAAKETARMSDLLRVARKYRARDLVTAARTKMDDIKHRRAQEEKEYYERLHELMVTAKRRQARAERNAQYREFGLSESDSTGDEAEPEAAAAGGGGAGGDGDGGGGGGGGDDAASRPRTSASSRLDTADLERPFTATSLHSDTDFSRPFTATIMGLGPSKPRGRRRSRRDSLKFPRPLQKVDKRQYKPGASSIAQTYVGKAKGKPDVLVLD